jgi:hypothetical protein
MSSRIPHTVAMLALGLAAGAADASSAKLTIGNYTESHDSTNALIGVQLVDYGGAQLRLYVDPDLYESFSAQVTLPPPLKFKRGSYYNLDGLIGGRAIQVNGTFGSGGCSYAAGYADIRQLVVKEGQVLTFDGTIVHTCTWGAGAPSGMPAQIDVKFNALPWFYQYDSTAGDPLGNGRRVNFTGFTTDMALVGTAATGFEYAVSGKREEWLVEFAPPAGQALVAGTTYTTSHTGGPGVAMLRVGSRDHVCASSVGSLTINGLKTNANTGKLSALNATYSVQCDGQPPLQGSIRYYL